MDKNKASLILSVLLVSAMGPYVLPQLGIRTEHFVMYALVFYFSLKSGLRFWVGNNKHVFTLVVLFSFLLLWAIVTTFIFGSNANLNKVLADIDNYTQPIWIILITSYCVRNLTTDESIDVLVTVIKTLVILLSVNLLISISSMFFGAWYLDYFNVAGEAQGDEGLGTILKGSIGQGRLTGIFNQPFEAGVAYGSGLISITYLIILRKNLSSQIILPAYLNWGFVSMVVGGVISVSKVFFPLSVFISLVFFALASKGFSKMLFSMRFLRSLFISITVLFLIAYFLLDQWSGLNYFLRLVGLGEGNYQESDLLEMFTAGRFTTTSGGTSVVAYHLNDPNLLFGYGFGSIQTPDSGFIELLYFGGIVGVLIYLSILFAIFYFAIKGLSSQSELAKYLVAMLLFIIFSTLGAPIFGINRANFFVIIPLIIVVRVLSLSGRYRNINSNNSLVSHVKLG